MKKKKNKLVKPIRYCHIAGIAGYITYVIAQVTLHVITLQVTLNLFIVKVTS